LLDQPENPPPAMELGFKPPHPYVPSAPSMFAKVEERLPQLLDRADATFQALSEIVARMPSTLERSDRFFTHVESIMHQSQLPALSADSRRFFNTTTGQIEHMRSEMDAVLGPQGTLTKFSEDTRAALNAANVPATSRSVRDAADNSRLAADDLRRSLPAIRQSLDQLRELARKLEEQPESVVYGSRSPEGKPK
jgi:phospholipid/cholesterol/gamma-HCH transport system substrate-binding protein